MSDFGKCASCGAEITWTMTAAGKKMPLDVESTPLGRFFVDLPKDPTAPLQCLSATSDDERAVRFRIEDRPRFDSHFATCPGAANHRKHRKKG
jgi:hypothetical protein